MTHPLTDEMCYQMSLENWGMGLTNDNMRSAYDLAIESMSQWIEENGHEYVVHYHDLGCQSNFSQMITDFKNAMRPQEDN